MRSNHRRPIVAALAIVLGLCLVTLLVAGYIAGSSQKSTASTTSTASTKATVGRPVTTKSIGLDKARCYFEQEHFPPVTIEQARSTIAPLLPTDARHIRTYNPADVPELTVDLYTSAWLKAQYKPEVFIGGEPGQFIVIHGPIPSTIARTAIACGNQP